MAPFTPLTASCARTIAAYSVHSLECLESEITKVEHRLDLINYWKIEPGSRVLEIGCGAGTCTSVLAVAVGPDGHVDGVDPGSPDYGAPITLAQGQTYISNSVVGDRITWRNAEPTEFLKKNKDLNWDYVVMAECIWYYSYPNDLVKMLQALRERVTSFLVAEWALKATEPLAVPHLLAAITRASLEAHNPNSYHNIRCMLTPTNIKDIATATGWSFKEETTIVPNERHLDGYMEVQMIKMKEFDEDVDSLIKEDRLNIMLKASKEAMAYALEASGVVRARSMDAWLARFN
ncbi:uncharacterized protein TRIVIDRAFT_151270 [Trichoderma virens Gv29-8]|uniref:Methyltransferase domain-containing protein n=1 Tax=Hypocrea virens (strain Gv29-8 / FGSC 10586) TaxID=413071 RepID=G9MU25_HYPVG|nr:uncharacterized protein TRIVIDRAFT_151270 [Trichoderma virens Gv29-8]EHK22051.1 hypothetical protein TRIVIDRAFT_151270 [Trichoderma virens Gv29-8]UKZ58376.1 hypothetical protein TrVGV298_012244 [Trichoderma virens]